MYKSPIELMRTQIETDFENQIITAVARTGIRVDKHELIKALQYDRNQYDKGFDDGRKETAKELIAAVKSCMQDFEDDDDGYILKKCEFEFFMREIAKQFGVEVEE